MENVNLNRRSDYVLGKLPEFSHYAGRLAVIAVPFITLYKPARVGVTALTCSLKIIDITQKDDRTKNEKRLLIAKQVAFLFCVIFRPKEAIVWAIAEQTYDDIKDKNAYAILSRMVYFTSLWNRDPRWVVAALALEIAKDGKEACDQINEGRWLEAGGKLLMAGLRTYQTKEEISRVRRRFFGKEVTQADWDEIVKTKDVEKALKEKNFSDVVKDVRVAPMQKKELYEVDLKNIIFERVDFSGSQLRKSSIENVTFKDCNMEGVFLYRVKLVHVIWERCNVTKGTFYLCKGMDTFFVSCDLTRFCLSECQMEWLEIFASKLYGASFLDNRLAHSILKSCDLTNVLLTNATFKYEDCKEHRITKPVVALTWDFASQGSWGEPVPDVLEDQGMLTLKFPIYPKNCEGLREEVRNKLEHYPLNGEKSRPQMLLDDPRKTPAIEMMKQRVRNVMTYADGAILSGGEDVEPIFYQTGEEGDDFRRSLLEFAVLHSGKPVMGICRGSQVINVYFGGTLKNVEGQTSQQELTYTEGAMGEALRSKIGGPVQGYSAHYQAVDRLGKGLHVLLEKDGVVKATIHENGRVLGTQFHPEAYVHEHRFNESLKTTNAVRILSRLPTYRLGSMQLPKGFVSGEPVFKEDQTLSKRGEKEVIQLINLLIQHMRAEWEGLQNNRIFFKIFYQMVSRGGSTLLQSRSSQGG